MSMDITCLSGRLSPKESPARSKWFTPGVGSHANAAGGQPANGHDTQYGPCRFDTNGSVFSTTKSQRNVMRRAPGNVVQGYYQPGSISHPS